MHSSSSCFLLLLRHGCQKVLERLSNILIPEVCRLLQADEVSRVVLAPSTELRHILLEAGNNVVDADKLTSDVVE